MGIFSNLFKQPSSQPPTVPTILPQTAKQQIASGILPSLNIDKILLKSGEVCHYADKAIYEKKIVSKHYVRHNQGVSMPGIFKGDRVHFGGGDTQVEQNITYEQIKGYLFVTNRRIVFVG